MQRLWGVKGGKAKRYGRPTGKMLLPFPIEISFDFKWLNFAAFT
ncbi:hypothetical protein ACCS91_10585 [Rhizobium ruizarguesonis]|nr:hypothetical protein [Rhizobium ruizarguesonis]